jgi:hypothetical protein
VSTIDDSSDWVRIRFIRDFQPSDKSVSYRSGSELLLDPVSAAALIMVGAAVRVSPGGANRGEKLD